MDQESIFIIDTLREILQKLVGFHKKLLEVVRNEKEALVQLELKAVENASLQKQNLIEEIYRTESSRLKCMADLSLAWRIPMKELSLSRVIEQLQASDVKKAEQFRSIYQTLTVLIQRISEQNTNNKHLVEKSLNHIFEMKKNTMREAELRSSTYTQQAQKTHSQNTSRLISKEA